MEKKKPVRTCIVCRQPFDKRELVRIVKNGEEISVDLTGKKNGRGAYICTNPDCLAKLKKQKTLNRAFKCEVSDAVYDSITEALLGHE